MQIKIKRVRENAQIPKYQTAGAAGFDFHAAIDEPVIIPSGKTAVIPTGLSLEVPVGYELQVRGRSGLAFKNDIGLVHGVGTIDPDFRGELMIKLINFGKEDFIVEPGMRIAQGVVARYETVQWQETDELSKTDRSGGFGSTGQ